MYLSGQVGRSVETGGKLVEGGIEAEAEQVHVLFIVFYIKH